MKKWLWCAIGLSFFYAAIPMDGQKQVVPSLALSPDLSRDFTATPDGAHTSRTHSPSPKATERVVKEFALKKRELCKALKLCCEPTEIEKIIHDFEDLTHEEYGAAKEMWICDEAELNIVAEISLMHAKIAAEQAIRENIKHLFNRIATDQITLGSPVEIKLDCAMKQCEGCAHNAAQNVRVLRELTLQLHAHKK